jgi:RimJ/RimL family protein N-acetyltransferase
MGGRPLVPVGAVNRSRVLHGGDTRTTRAERAYRPGPGCLAGTMADVRTSRLQLHAIDVAEGERIVARAPGPEDSWADDFPFDGDIGAVRGFLRATERGEQRPFGFYRVSRLADGLAIGGIGFKGQPEDGCVEVGYGLVPSARGNGYAAEAVVALLAIAKENGLSRVIADTARDNIASQRSLARAGFRLVGSNGELHYFEALLD